MSLGTISTGATAPRLLPRLSRIWRDWGGHRDLAKACQLVPDILAAAAFQAPVPSVAKLRIQSAEWAQTHVAVIKLGEAGQLPTLILKIPSTHESVASLQTHHAVLTTLCADSRLAEFRDLLPWPLAAGELDGQFYLAERALIGHKAEHLLFDPEARMKIQMAAATAIGQLHQRTATAVTISADLIERWVDRPLSRIRDLKSVVLRAAHKDAAIERVRAELHRVLAGHTLSVCWIHGDFWPGNLLVSANDLTLTGIVDWDMASPNDLLRHDLFHLILYTRALVERRDLGDIVRNLLAKEDWTFHERALLETAGPALSDNDIGDRAMILLYWLRHIQSNLDQSAGYSRHWLWIAKNVDNVLKCL